MAKIKGKFITLSTALMTIYKDGKANAEAMILEKTGKTSRQLDQEGFYDTKLWGAVMDEYAKASPTGDRAYITLGRNIYPTIKKTAGFPDHLKTVLDFIVYEGEGYELNHSGDDVIPRTWIKKSEGEVIVEAPAPGYNCKLYEGVFLGILQMQGEKNGNVVQKKCQKQGDETCEFHITW